MVETAAGHRILVAPTQELADFIATTYTFDEVRVEPVELVDGDHSWQFRSSSLLLDLALGGRTGLGRLVRLVPKRVATAPAWCTITDPIARLALRGVRTRGSAGNGRKEWYGATGVRAITEIDGTLDGTSLGSLARVDPPCRFGFSSSPRRPVVTDVVTTIELPDSTG